MKCMSIKTVHQIRSTRSNSQFSFSEKEIVSIVEEVCNGFTRKEALLQTTKHYLFEVGSTYSFLLLKQE